MTPEKHLKSLHRDYPEKIFQTAEMLMRKRGNDLPDWPAHCLLPMSAWASLNEEGR